MSNFNEKLKDSVRNYAISFFQRKTEEKQPSNIALYLVVISAFVLLAILDLITSVVVGGMTNWLYGVLTFGVGIGPTIVNEFAFVRSYASRIQKGLAIAGIVIGVLATLGIGVLAGGVSSANYFEVLDTTPFKTIIEILMLVSLVIISGVHVTIWMVYVFVDTGIQNAARHQRNKAESVQRSKDFEMAKADMEIAIKSGNELAELVDEGKGGIIDEAYRSITGKSLVPPDDRERF